MYLIQDILVSEDVLKARFACDVPSCKGACCWEGDYGAPLEPEEVAILDAEWPAIRPYVSPAGASAILRQGTSVTYPDLGKEGTPLIDGGPCAYMTLDARGIASCGIERAWSDGATPFRKPVSCHLYPIRVVDGGPQGLDGLNYHEWSICQPACARGEREQIPLVRFAREALVRRFGEAFFEALDDAAARFHETDREEV